MTSKSRSAKRSGGGGLGVVLLIGLAVKFWPWVLAALLAWMAVNVCRRLRDQYRAADEERRAKDAEIAARADAQYRAGPGSRLGMYGNYQPERIV